MNDERVKKEIGDAEATIEYYATLSEQFYVAGTHSNHADKNNCS